MIGLTSKQLKCLRLIEDSFERHGIAPSHDELCAALGSKSKGSPNRILGILESRGYIRRVKGHARAIELVTHSRTICPNCNHEFEPALPTLRRGKTLGGPQSPDNAVEGEISRGCA